jgi:uncharacterized phage protein gp47/JayE
VQPGTITVLTNTPNGVSGVSNPGAFVGGTDEEDTELFRLRLLEYVRNPQTGSAADLKSWAEDVAGVEAATVFENDNLGTPTNGHVTVRVSGPGGTTAPQAVLDTVYATLKEQDLANISIHVAGFTPLTTNVTVDVTLEGTYSLADVTAMVQQEIVNYIHSIPVGGTLYVAGIIDAVFSLPGILDVTVTTPSSNQTTTTSQKRIPGVITVT